MEPGDFRLVRFGVFELDLAARQLRKNGTRIKLQDQPFRVLQLLLERPGEVVTREELKEKLWSEDTFVEFDHSLNTAIQKIRRALGDSADNPRFVETVPKVGYRFVAPVAPPGVASTESQGTKSRWPVAATVAFVAVAIAFAAWVYRPETQEPPSIRRVPRQLTADRGVSVWPDISPDGKLVVYASDRDGGPDLDLWLLHVDGGEPVRLTDQPGNEVQPRLSPDGSRVVYYYDPENSVYTVTTVGGGQPTLVARRARTPRFSPDGRFLAFTQDSTDLAFSASLVVANADGSEQRRLDYGMRFTGAGILWLPDGRLLVGGNPKTANPRDGDWYIAAIDGSAIVPVGATAHLPQHLQMTRPPPFEPQAWLEGEQAILFSARDGDSIELWRMPFSVQVGRVTGPPERFTSGGSLEYDASATLGGEVVYSSIQQNIDLWSLPIDSNTATRSGSLQRLTTGVGSEFRPRISADGSTIAYSSASSSRNAQNSQIHIADVSPWRERTAIGPVGWYGDHLLGRDGREIVYETRIDGERRILSTSIREGTPRRLCGDCGPLLSWSPKGRYLIHRGTAPASQLVAFDIETGRQHVVVEHPRYVPHDARLSPDEQWVAFHAWTRGVLYRRVYLARFQTGQVAEEDDWIPLTSPEHNSFRPEWSPDGRRIYYFSNRGGPFAIWSQRLDDASKAPLGDPDLVYTGGGDEPSLEGAFTSGMGLPRMAVGEDFLIFDAIEKSGDIWLLNPIEEPE